MEWLQLPGPFSPPTPTPQPPHPPHTVPIVYFAERINQLAGKHWRSFAKQNYFDPQVRGVLCVGGDREREIGDAMASYYGIGV